MKDIYNYIDENIEEYVSDLQELIENHLFQHKILD